MEEEVIGLDIGEHGMEANSGFESKEVKMAISSITRDRHFSHIYGTMQKPITAISLLTQKEIERI